MPARNAHGPVGSLLWRMVLDGFRPDRYDVAGAAICLVGVTVIMYAPRAAQALQQVQEQRRPPEAL